MDENRFQMRGVTYVAQEAQGCGGCAFAPRDEDLQPEGGAWSEGCRAAPACSALDRQDSRSVVFVREMPEQEGFKVAIVVRGGLVTAVYTNNPDTTDIVIIDFDNIDAGDDLPDEEWAQQCAAGTPPKGFWVEY